MKSEIKVGGMHCASCGILIYDALSEINGVENVEVDHIKGIVSFQAKGKKEIEKVKKAVKREE